MAALPSLKQLQYLVALAEHLNFTRAAESCFVTQSTLSAGLKELEEVLSAPLVERDRQSVLMTPLGEEIARRARDVLAATRDLAELAAGATEPMAGPLRLGIIPTIAPFLLPCAMKLLRENHPRLQLFLREDITSDLIARLDDGRLDFALIALPYATGNLLVQALFDDPLWLVVRRGDPEAKTAAVLPKLKERLLLLEEGHCLREHTLQACAKTPAPASGNVEATSLLTLVQMVESGLGLALVPEMAILSGLAQSAGLLARALGKPSPCRTIALVARRSTSRLSELTVLGEVFREARSRMDNAAP